VKKAAPVKKVVKKAAPVKKVVKKAAPVKKVVKKAAPVKKAAAATKAAPAKKVATKAAPAAKVVDTVVEPEVRKSVMPPRPPRPPAPEPKPMKPVKYPFDAKFLQSQRELLLYERGRLLHDADTLTAEANALAELREPGDVQFDEESGEGDTLAVERERDLALSAQFRDQIVEIDRAMLKIDAGTYGICEVSGQPIPRERLKAISWARERVEYKVGGFGRR
jgi:RNA polymerase-binding transcription factor DksA